MSADLIAVKNLRKDYRMGELTVQALRGVTVAIGKGEFVAIMGASGSGKTTFMNILGCLDIPSGGEYWLEGEEVGKLNRDERAIIRRQKLGFVFQGFNLLSRANALENVEMPLIYSGVPRLERHRRAREALAGVGLGDRSDHHPSQLSGGQQQRVAIARALVTNPSLLLADEPTGNLDSHTSAEIMTLLQTLNRERGVTIILVTHEHDIADYAGRRIHFKDGEIVEDNGNPEEGTVLRH